MLEAPGHFFLWVGSLSREHMAHDDIGRARPLRLAGIVLGLLLLTMVPYARGIWLEYRRFRTYADATLHHPDAATTWQARIHEPPECTRAGIRWFAGCPGLDVFCIDGLREVVRRCMKSQDRARYCRSLDGAWASTRFGHSACDTAMHDEPDPAVREVLKNHCGTAYREVANHCMNVGEQHPRPVSQSRSATGT